MAIAGMKPVAQRNLERGDIVERRSWKNLAFYLELCERMLQGYLVCARGGKDDTWEKVKDFVNRMEWEMREDFDSFEFKYSFSWVFPYLQGQNRRLETDG